MANETYPNSFLRGLSSRDFVEKGQVLPLAFQFDDNGRSDGNREASINWYDDEGALSIALNQRKENGKLQFPAGVAKVDLELLKLILRNLCQEGFSFERAPLENNKYHGNLLLSNCLKKSMRQLIMSGLALAASTNIIEQSNVD